MVPEYPSNSHKSKQEAKVKVNQPKKIDKIVNGKVTVKKQKESQKFINGLIPENMSDFKSTMISEVILPATRKFLSDSIISIVENLFGTSRRSGSHSGGIGVSYDKYYRDKDDRFANRVVQSAYKYDNLIFESYGEAKLVLDQLDAMIDEYGIVSVADLYDAVGLARSWTDCDYGWTNLRNASVVPDRNGYLLRMPNAMPIK